MCAIPFSSLNLFAARPSSCSLYFVVENCSQLSLHTVYVFTIIWRLEDLRSQTLGKETHVDMLAVSFLPGFSLRTRVPNKSAGERST